MVKSETRLQGSGGEVLISPDRPATLIGVGIDALRNPNIADAVRRMDLGAIKGEAQAQWERGAEVLAVTAAGAGIDEAESLPRLVAAVADSVPLPLCIGAEDLSALEAGLAACPGKPLAWLVDQSEDRWSDFLAIARGRGAAVLVTGTDKGKVPAGYQPRVETCRRIVRECISAGIPRADVILDPVVQPLTIMSTAEETLRLTSFLSQVDAINLCLRVGEIAIGLPHAEQVESAFVALAVSAGVTCPMVHPDRLRETILITNSLLGRGGFCAERFLETIG